MDIGVINGQSPLVLPLRSLNHQEAPRFRQTLLPDSNLDSLTSGKPRAII